MSHDGRTSCSVCETTGRLDGDVSDGISDVFVVKAEEKSEGDSKGRKDGNG